MLGSTAFSLLLCFSGASLVLSEDYLRSGSLSLDEAGSGITPAAAASEFEMITLRIPSVDKERKLVSWTLQWKGKSGPMATWYRGATAEDLLPGAPQVTDALVPLEAVGIPAGVSFEIVLQLEVPVDAVPGDYRADLRLEFEDGAVLSSDFPLVVYDVVLPEAHSLATLFDLDLQALAATYGLSFGDLDAWIPVYDTLQSLGIGYRVWFDTHSDGTLADEADLQAHLNYVAATGAPGLVDVGGKPGILLDQFPEASATEPQDGLQLQLYKTQARLPAVAGALKRVAQPMDVGPRTTWNSVRQGYARFARADAHVQRILAAPAHPYFERYADIWALPVATDPAVLGRLRSGQSLKQYEQQDVGLCIGSAGTLDKTATYQTLASETVDGSEVTYWQADASEEVPYPWLEISFRAHVRLAQLTVLTLPGASWEGVQVETAYVPGEFTVATVSWEAQSEASPLGNSVVQGTFRYPRECLAVRLRFDGRPDGAALPAVAEILFNNPTLETQETAVPSHAPWLDGTDDGYTVWQAGQGRSARALAWRCWTLGFHGVLGPALNAPGPGALIAMGVNHPLPTRRLFAFRDGLEDYEYLQIFWERVARKELSPPAGFFPGAGAEGFDVTDAGVAMRRAMRDRIGEILSGKSQVTRNFGP